MILYPSPPRTNPIDADACKSQLARVFFRHPEVAARHSRFMVSNVYSSHYARLDTKDESRPRRAAFALQSIRAHMPSGGLRTLELGCGMGMNLWVIADALSPVTPKLYGVEMWEEGVRRAAQSNVGATALDLNVDPLSYRDSFFESVLR